MRLPCPGASKLTYIHGVRIYKSLIQRAVSDTDRQKLIDKLMQIYQRRIEFFGDRDQVLGYQGTDLLTYDETRFEEAYTILKEAVKSQGQDAKVPVLGSYFKAATLKLQNQTLSNSDYVATYKTITIIIDSALADQSKTKSHKNFKDVKEAIDSMYFANVK